MCFLSTETSVTWGCRPSHGVCAAAGVCIVPREKLINLMSGGPARHRGRGWPVELFFALVCRFDGSLFLRRVMNSVQTDRTLQTDRKHTVTT